MRPVETRQPFAPAPNRRRVGHYRSEQRQRQSQAAEDDIFPRRFERGLAVVQRHQQHGRQRGGLQREPHHTQVVRQHHQEHAGGKYRREHEELLDAARRHHLGGEVAAKIASGVERRCERHRRDEQHHPRAQRIGVEKFVPFRHHAVRWQHLREQPDAQRQRGGKRQDVDPFHEPPPSRRRQQASQRSGRRDRKNECQQHILLLIVLTNPIIVSATDRTLPRRKLDW